MANRNYYRHNKSSQRLPQEVQGDKAVLELAVEELGLNQPTLELLKNNNINTLYDLARRTEREMFRIQTFSKKQLLEIKPKLNSKGLNFYPAEERPANNEAQSQQTNNTVAVQQVNKSGNETPRINKPQRETSKPVFGRDNKFVKDNGNQPRDNRDNRDKNRDVPHKELRPPIAQKNVLLPVAEWRKVNKNGKWGFNNGLTTVIEPVYDEVYLFKDDLACVEIDEKCGYINSSGEVVIPITYECAMSFSEGLASIVVNGKCGYINKQNEIIIPPQYDAATPFENGRAKVKQDGKWGTIDPLGNILWSK